MWKVELNVLISLIAFSFFPINNEIKRYVSKLLFRERVGNTENYFGNISRGFYSCKCLQPGDLVLFLPQSAGHFTGEYLTELVSTYYREEAQGVICDWGSISQLVYCL